MKFTIPKITRELDLAEYDPAWGDLKIRVWVNPPINLLDRYNQMLDDSRQVIKDSAIEGYDPAPVIQRIETETAEIMSELWSQGPEETHWTPEEIREMIEQTQKTDPVLWIWLRNCSIEMIRDHRGQIKKD